MKVLIAAISALSLGLLFFIVPTQKAPDTRIDRLLSSEVLCSTFNAEGKCVGSVYCTACKNCKYCGYCNSGGSCGVCGKKPRKTYRTPKPKKENNNPGYTPSPHSSKPEGKEPKPKPTTEHKIYSVIQKTSLRESGDSKAKVLKRLEVNEEVIVIEATGQYWWKVICKSQRGWVKKHLLKEKNIKTP